MSVEIRKGGRRLTCGHSVIHRKHCEGRMRRDHLDLTDEPTCLSNVCELCDGLTQVESAYGKGLFYLCEDHAPEKEFL